MFDIITGLSLPNYRHLHGKFATHKSLWACIIDRIVNRRRKNISWYRGSRRKDFFRVNYKLSKKNSCISHSAFLRWTLLVWLCHGNAYGRGWGVLGGLSAVSICERHNTYNIRGWKLLLSSSFLPTQCCCPLHRHTTLGCDSVPITTFHWLVARVFIVYSISLVTQVSRLLELSFVVLVLKVVLWLYINCHVQLLYLLVFKHCSNDTVGCLPWRAWSPFSFKTGLWETLNLIFS